MANDKRETRAAMIDAVDRHLSRGTTNDPAFVAAVRTLASQARHWAEDAAMLDEMRGR